MRIPDEDRIRELLTAERDAALQALQRVWAVVHEWDGADPDAPNHELWRAIRRALLDGAS